MGFLVTLFLIAVIAFLSIGLNNMQHPRSQEKSEESGEEKHLPQNRKICSQKILSSRVESKLAQKYLDCYQKALKAIQSNPIIDRNKIASFELFPLLYVLTDYCAATCKMDRVAVSNQLIAAMKPFHIDWTVFDRRTSLYGKFVRGKIPRAIYTFGQHPQERGFTDTLVVFGDILYNPQMADDYDSAPTLIEDINFCLNFSDYFFSRVVPIFFGYINHFLEENNAPLRKP